MGQLELLLGKGHPPLRRPTAGPSGKVYIVVTESDGGTDAAAFSSQRAADRYERDCKQQILNDNGDDELTVEDAEENDYFGNMSYYVSQHHLQIDQYR